MRSIEQKELLRETASMISTVTPKTLARKLRDRAAAMSTKTDSEEFTYLSGRVEKLTQVQLDAILGDATAIEGRRDLLEEELRKAGFVLNIGVKGEVVTLGSNGRNIDVKVIVQEYIYSGKGSPSAIIAAAIKKLSAFA